MLHTTDFTPARTSTHVGHAHPAPCSRIVIFRADLPAIPSGRTLTAITPRVTAVFPCEPAMDGQMLGYTQGEGYMTCSRLWFDLSRPAKPDQSADLVAHLKAKGFDLDIRHRITPAMDTTRDRRWEEEKAAEARAFEDLRDAETACLAAMDLCQTVAGFGREDLLSKRKSQPEGLHKARRAAFWLSHEVFGVPVGDVAGVYRRDAGHIRDALACLSRQRATDAGLAIALGIMERLALDRMTAA